MAISVLEFCELANASYYKNKGVGGWKVQHWSANEGSGFYGAIYQDPNRGVVVAFRGSDDWLDWTDADYNIALRKLPMQQVIDAMKLYGAVSKFTTGKPAVTGHSLGGGLAQVVAVVFNCQGVTFNAPGMKSHIKAYVGKKVSLPDDLDSRVVNFRDAWDPVSAGTGDHIGKRISLSISRTWTQTISSGLTMGLAGAATAHSLTTILDYIKTKSWKTKSPFGQPDGTFK